MAQLSSLRTRLELIISVPSASAYVSSQTELDDLNEAYHKTAYTWNWPQLLVKRGARILNGQKKYAVPSNFQKFHSLYVLGGKRDEVDLDLVRFTANSYGVDLETSEFILRDTPGSNGAQFTLSAAAAAGNAVTVAVNSVSGLTAGDEIVFPDDGNPEVSYISSISSANTTITLRLNSSKSSGAVFYRGQDNIMFNYYRTVTDLSAATDSPLLPSAVHFLICNYAAYLAYIRIEQYTEAEKNFNYWKEQVEDYWRAFKKGSTGSAVTFGIK